MLPTWRGMWTRSHTQSSHPVDCICTCTSSTVVYAHTGWHSEYSDEKRLQQEHTLSTHTHTHTTHMPYTHILLRTTHHTHTQSSHQHTHTNLTHIRSRRTYTHTHMPYTHVLLRTTHHTRTQSSHKHTHTHTHTHIRSRRTHIPTHTPHTHAHTFYLELPGVWVNGTRSTFAECSANVSFYHLTCLNNIRCEIEATVRSQRFRASGRRGPLFDFRVLPVYCTRRTHCKKDTPGVFFGFCRNGSSLYLHHKEMTLWGLQSNVKKKKKGQFRYSGLERRPGITDVSAHCGISERSFDAIFLSALLLFCPVLLLLLSSFLFLPLAHSSVFFPFSAFGPFFCLLSRTCFKLLFF